LKDEKKKGFCMKDQQDEGNVIRVLIPPNKTTRGARQNTGKASGGKAGSTRGED